MGAYLSEPNTKKESIDDELGQLSYGASSMQGWRLEQEDAHNAILNFDLETKTSFFAVYDGHGGAEVAQYCAKYLPEYLKTLDEYKNGKLEDALRELFLKFDESLLSEKAEKELRELREKSQKDSMIEEEEDEDEEEEDDDEDTEEEMIEKKKEYTNEADALYDEACMPLEEVLKRYSNTEKKVKKVLKKNGIKVAESTTTTTNQIDSTSLTTICAPPSTTTDFNKQEELDIKEIKKNGNKETNETQNENSNHEIDEASNLCELTDSQKSESNTQHVAVVTKTEPKSLSDSSTTSNHKSSKPKLNKEELKLSPIHKKSSLCDEASNDDANATVVNGNDSPNKTKEEQAEANNNTKKQNLTRSHLIAKLLAGCINKKLKQGKNGKKAKNKDEEEEANEEEEDEDFVPVKEENGNDEEEDDDYENEEDDDDEEEDSEDEDDDYEDEDDDYEDEDDDEEDDEEAGEEEDEEEDYSATGAGSTPGYDSGCTAVVAVLRDNKYLYVANAGDSRCVVCREGKAIEMSFDHKPEDDIERERVEKAGGHVTRDGRINNGLNLSRAIGDHSYKGNKELPLSEQMITALPDIQKLEIDSSKDSFMVLACDGIWNFMSSQDVCDYIQERLNANYSKLSQVCEELFMHCLAPNSEGDGTGCDNMTCIIVTFKPFRKIELKLNNINVKNASQSLLVSTDNDKLTLKRSFQNGSNDDDEKLINGVNEQTALAKKLKQDE